MSTASTAALVQVSAVQAHKILLFLKLLAGSTWRSPKIRPFLVTAQGGLTEGEKEHPPLVKVNLHQVLSLKY